MRKDLELGLPTARRHFLGIAAATTARLATLPLVASLASVTSSTPVKAETQAEEDAEEAIETNTAQEAQCFLGGTRIRTPDGEIAIEDLEIGDLVETLNGALPVKWIGRRTFKKTVSRWPLSVAPIRVARFALHDQYPHRDLYLSPEHCLFIDGALIPVKWLVNGRSVVSAAMDDSEGITYFHIELDRHEVIFAEGAPAETLIVTTGRERFANFIEYERLYGSGEQPTMKRFAPLLGYDGGRAELEGLLRLALSSIGGARDPIRRAYDRILARAELANA
jgi:hypothetical protein